MKTTTLIVATALAMGSLPTLAASDAPPATTPQGGMAMMPMMGQMQQMHGQMAQILATEDPTERQQLLQEHFESMQGMMQMMHGMMGAQGTMMGGMMGGMTPGQRGMHAGHDVVPGQPCAMTESRGGMMSGPGHMGGPAGMAMGDMHGQMQGRMNLMQERLDAMQLLMDQMLKNQHESMRSMPGMGGSK